MYPTQARPYPGAKPSPIAVGDLLLATALLWAVMSVPSAVSFLYTAASHSTGTSIVSVLILAVLGLRTLTTRAFVILAMIVLAIAVHLGIALLMTPESAQWERALLSLVLFGLIFLAAYALGSWVFVRSPAVINGATALVRIACIAVAVAEILEIQPDGVVYWAKSIFPFTEPSHYALIFTPLLLDACVKSRGWRRIAWIATGYLMAYALESLSLAVGTTLAAIVTAPLPQLIAAVVVAPTLLVSVDLTYFLDRLDFGSQTNLSALVYTQGWDFMLDSVDRTYGWGIGFQQLGYGSYRSEASEIIFRMANMELNLQDGGFTAAKLISELGIFGIALTGGFVFIAVRAALLLRRVAFDATPTVPGRDFALCLIVGYSVDMFVRGVGYFAGSSLLFLAALVFYLGHRRRNAKNVL